MVDESHDAKSGPCFCVIVERDIQVSCHGHSYRIKDIRKDVLESAKCFTRYFDALARIAKSTLAAEGLNMGITRRDDERKGHNTTTTACDILKL